MLRVDSNGTPGDWCGRSLYIEAAGRKYRMDIDRGLASIELFRCGSYAKLVSGDTGGRARMHHPSLLHRGKSSNCQMHDVPSSTRTPHAVDNADWLKTVAIISVSVGHFGYFFVEDDRWWSRFRTPRGSNVLLSFGLRADQDRPATLDLARCPLDPARELECKMDMGSTEHSFELGAHPQCTAVRANPFATLRLGRLRLARFRTFRGIVDNGQDCRLWLGGMAVGPVRLMPTHVCRRQISDRRGWPSPKLGTPRARDEGERGPNATAGLLCRRGRLRLAGTKGILVSSNPVRRLHSSGSAFGPRAYVCSCAGRAASNRRKP